MKLDHQILIFTYHKTGTTLFEKVFTAISERHGLNMAKCYGMVPFIDPRPDIVMVIHAQLGSLPTRPFRGIRSIRDPRDILVSAYNYHKHCTEKWCVSTDFDPSPPIRFPRVPAAYHHLRERWKRDYLKRLGGISYQQNILMRDRGDGIAFELENYVGVILDSMWSWPHRDERIVDVKMEDTSADFDGSMSGVFRHLGFAEADVPELLEIAGDHDVGRMDDAALAADPHIHGRDRSKWRTFLTEAEIAGFERRYGDLVSILGYERAR